MGDFKDFPLPSGIKVKYLSILYTVTSLELLNWINKVEVSSTFQEHRSRFVYLMIHKEKKPCHHRMSGIKDKLFLGFFSQKADVTDFPTAKI